MLQDDSLDVQSVDTNRQMYAFEMVPAPRCDEITHRSVNDVLRTDSDKMMSAHCILFDDICNFEHSGAIQETRSSSSAMIKRASGVYLSWR